MTHSICSVWVRHWSFSVGECGDFKLHKDGDGSIKGALEEIWLLLNLVKMALGKEKSGSFHKQVAEISRSSWDSQLIKKYLELSIFPYLQKGPILSLKYFSLF